MDEFVLSPGEIATVEFEFDDELDGAELLTGTPTVTIDDSAVATLNGSAALSSDSKSVTHSVTAASDAAGKNAWLTCTPTTDTGSPAHVKPRRVMLKVRSL
jgi:hypothetical protein